MKKNLSSCIQIFLILALLFSCKEKNDNQDRSSSFRNLREKASFLDEEIAWTEELEHGRLSAEVKQKNGISDKVALSPLVVSAVLSEGDTRVYPVLDGFTSLDTSQIEDSLWTFLSQFSESFIKDESLENYFFQDSKISLTLFYIAFDKVFGQKKDSENKNLFTSFVVGSPFAGSDFTEVPVKFFSDESELLLNLFCAKSGNSWKAEQIQFVAGEAERGQI